MLALSKLSVPVVTAVNGAAAGIGCSLALAGDFTLAGKSAYFLQAFVNIGLVPDGRSSWMLARLVGKARATEMMLLGERISAEKAEQWGLIYRAVEDADLQAQALAQHLACRSPLSTLRCTPRGAQRMTRGLSDSPFLPSIELSSTTICRLTLAHCYIIHSKLFSINVGKILI